MTRVVQAHRTASTRARSLQQLLDGRLGRDGIHRQARAQLQAGDLAQARMDLPVPVERGVDALAQRRGVQDEVVGRAVEAGPEPAEHLRGAPGPWPEPRRRRPGRSPPRASRGTIQTSNGEREPHGANATVESSSQTSRSRVRASSRTSRHHGHSPFADHEARRAAELLGDPMRDERQVVQVEAQVVRPGAGLRAPVLDDLEVVGLGGAGGLGDRVAGEQEHLLGERRRPGRAARCSPGGAAIVRQLPAARASDDGDLGDAPVELVALLLVPMTWNA